VPPCHKFQYSIDSESHCNFPGHCGQQCLDMVHGLVRWVGRRWPPWPHGLTKSSVLSQCPLVCPWCASLLHSGCWTFGGFCGLWLMLLLCWCRRGRLLEGCPLPAVYITAAVEPLLLHQLASISSPHRSIARYSSRSSACWFARESRRLRRRPVAFVTSPFIL
jgi:hypothetical protein